MTLPTPVSPVRFPITVPNSTTLVGVVLFEQAAALAGPGNVTPLVLSNGMLILIGG
jgi:hypothetical protein